MNSGVFVADEVRDWFDLAPLANGDGQQSFMPINTQLLEQALFTLKQQKEAPNPLLSPPGGNGNGNGAPKSSSGAPAPSGNQPQNGRPSTPGHQPPRKPAPAVTPRSDNGHMTEDEAWHIVQSALDQARRMQYAADLSLRVGQEEGE
jgi:hypothetical protein